MGSAFWGLWLSCLWLPQQHNTPTLPFLRILSADLLAGKLLLQGLSQAQPLCSFSLLPHKSQLTGKEALSYSLAVVGPEVKSCQYFPRKSAHLHEVSIRKKNLKRSRLSINNLIQSSELSHCECCPLIEIMKSSFVTTLWGWWRPSGRPSLQEVSSDSETWWFNTRTEQNSKEQEVEQNSLPSGNSLLFTCTPVKQRSDEPTYLPFWGISPDGASPRKMLW